MTAAGPPKKVLFLCTANASRSQMAEGWARTLLAGLCEPYSAGTRPHALNPWSVRVMAEAGVDIAGQRPKHVDELAGVPFDLVVTVCDRARESCPVWPQRTRVLHRGFPDPPVLAADARTEEERLERYREVRDAIRAFVDGELRAILEGGET